MPKEYGMPVTMAQYVRRGVFMPNIGMYMLQFWNNRPLLRRYVPLVLLGITQ